MAWPAQRCFFKAVVYQLSSAQTAGALAVLAIVAVPLRDLAGVWDRYRNWQIAREKCLALFAIPVLKVTQGRGQLAQRCPSRRARQLVLQQIGFGPLQGISAQAEAGEKIAIVGPNGAGKSTLLQLIAGLVEAEYGTIYYGSLPAKPQCTSVAQPASSGLIHYCGPRSPVLRGSLRRVQLARAYLARPAYLLLDEPDDALDYADTQLVIKLIRERSATSFLVTHNPVLAAQMDTIWTVAGGMIAEAGPAIALLEGQGVTAGLFNPGHGDRLWA